MNVNHRRSRDTKEEEEKEGGGGGSSRGGGGGGDSGWPIRGGERGGMIHSSLVDGAFNSESLIFPHGIFLYKCIYIIQVQLI